MSLATQQFDLVVEGEATLVTDSTIVADLAARWAAHGWPARVDDTGRALTAEFSAPSAGPPPWHVYRLTPHTATAVGTVDPGGATAAGRDLGVMDLLIAATAYAHSARLYTRNAHDLAGIEHLIEIVSV